MRNFATATTNDSQNTHRMHSIRRSGHSALQSINATYPITHISRRAFCRENVVEVTRSVYRADRYTLWVPVLRPEHLR